MQRILVVDDHGGYRTALRIGLEKAGYTVAELGRGGDLLRVARAVRPDAVILDLDLPDASGVALCQALKHQPETRSTVVVIATGRDAEEDRVSGFEAGADDYVVKPFSMRELVLRLRVLIRRPPMSVVKLGLLTVDFDAHRALVAGRPAELTRLELAVLRLLYARRSSVLSRDDLLDCARGLEGDVGDRVVDRCVERLRQKLGPAGRYILTVRGAGYRLANDA